MESLSLIICILIFICICLFLFILHQRTTNSKQSYPYTKNLRHTYFNSSIMKCITLCNKLCYSIKTTHQHDFEANNINNNIDHTCNVNKLINPVNVHISSSTILDPDQQTNSLTYEPNKCIENYKIFHNPIYYNNNVNVNGKYSQSSMTIDHDPIKNLLFKSNSNLNSKNYFIHKTSDSSLSCSYLNDITNPFDITDNNSSNLNSLLDKISQHKIHFNNNNSRRLECKNSRTKIECVQQQEMASLNSESPWVKANNTTHCSSSITGQSNQSSCSSNEDEILLSICPKARDPTNILADIHVPLNKIIFNNVVLQGNDIFVLHMEQLCAYYYQSFINYKEYFLFFTITIYLFPLFNYIVMSNNNQTEKATAEQVRLFKSDACKFVGAKHSHISSIIAASSTSVCVSSLSNQQIINQPILIYSNAKYGNLKLFLQRRSNGNMRPNVILTAAQLINMALQILSAADYLHSINVIHEDIATRNCLLKCRTRVALSDSALSRDLFPEDYHCLGDNTNRPVKWLALEALIERKYTMATDVWSVGITLWELITRGQQPYASIDAFEMTAVLRTGYRLKKPHNCPDDLWKIIFACWKTNPSARPTIRQLIAKLKAFKVAVTNYI
uniref:Tyrosine-protein kinase RYK n=2 Tax=Schistosoma TaxID=6181 RepID=A0A094ZNY5_SCHHA